MATDYQVQETGDPKTIAHEERNAGLRASLIRGLDTFPSIAEALRPHLADGPSNFADFEADALKAEVYFASMLDMLRSWVKGVGPPRAPEE